MNYTEADHVWFIERIEAYLGGGLGGDELARFESHAAACLPCEAKLGDSSRADAALRAMFAEHRPAAGLEDRAIAGVRSSLDRHRPLVLNPKIRRAAGVAAAGLLLATMGYVGKLALDGGSLARFNPGRLFAKSPAAVVSDLRRAGRGSFSARTGDAGQPARRAGAPRDRTVAQERAIFTGTPADNEAAVRAQLDRRLPEANFNGNSLSDVVDFVRDVSGANIDVNWKKLEDAGINKETPINLRLKDAKMSEVLPQVLASAAQGKASLGYSVDSGVIHVTTANGSAGQQVTPSPVASAQAQIRDGKYQEALGTVDQILKTDPKNDYALGVRRLVNDKATLAAAQHREQWGELDEKSGKSLKTDTENRASYEDALRRPPNGPASDEGREVKLRYTTNRISGKGAVSLGTTGLTPAEVNSTVLTPEIVIEEKGGPVDLYARGTVTVPDGGTLLLGGQTLDGVTEGKPADGPKAVTLNGGSLVVLSDGTNRTKVQNGTSDGTERELRREPVLTDVNGDDVQKTQMGREITKSGSGTVILNGENSYAGATSVTAGTLDHFYAGAPVTGKPPAAANGKTSTPEYGYIDRVTAPKVAEAQHAKLGELASTDQAPTHRGWAFQGGVAFNESVTLGDGDQRRGELSPDKPKEMSAKNLSDVRSTEHEARGRAKFDSKEQQLGISEARQKRSEQFKQVDEQAEDKLKVAGGDSAGGEPQNPKTISSGRTGSDLAAKEPVVAFNFQRVVEDPVKQTVRRYDTQDLKTDIPDFTPPPDLALAQGNATDPATRAATTGATSTGVPPTAGQQQQPAPVQRKIIRNGEVVFEVDSFDSSYIQIGKIVAEEGGYIGTTDSEKLPNGKVKGTVQVRVPPDRLDVLILKLRGLGDLKNQKIAAQDVTKQFVDSESLLRADKAMEERLLELIKNGKGEVKDLVAAEKELGNYREKIEQLEGELRYLQSQVSLSTLNITLFERDIKTPTAAFEAETVDTAIETEEVEKARADAIKSVEDAKGRVIESQMKRFEAGQLQATIVAEVAPENAGPVIDRLKQLGRVARFDVERKQTTQGGQGAPVGLKLEKRATVIKVSIYNLANIAPRETVNVSLAAEDVEKAYKAILAAAEVEEQVNGVAVKVGRVVSSSLNSQRADQTTGNITIEVRADRAAAVETAIRGAGGVGGEVMHMTVTENPDANNVTRAKRGYVVTLASLASVAPRETAVLSVAAKDVPTLYQTLMAQLQDGKEGKGRGKVYASRLEEQDRQNVEAFVDFEIPRGESANIEALLNSGTTSDVFRRNVTRSPDVTNTLDSKVRMQVSILNVGRLRPREESAFNVEVSDPEASLLAVQGIATAAGGRTYEPHLNKDESGKIEGRVTFDVPLSAASATADRLRALGIVRESRSLTNESVPAGNLAKARFDVTLVNAKQLVAANHGVGARIREGVSTSLDALLLLLEWLIVVAPFVLVLWLLWKFFRRGRKEKLPVTPKPVAG